MSSKRPQFNQASSSFPGRDRPLSAREGVTAASSDLTMSRNAQENPASDTMQYSRQSASAAEGVHTSSAPRVTSARGSAQNRQQFFQRSARVSSVHDPPEGTGSERGKLERSSSKHHVTFAQKDDFEDDIWMDVESPSTESSVREVQTGFKEHRASPETSLQRRKQAALYKAKDKQDITQTSMYYDTQEKLDEGEQFQTPPSTPVDAFSHKKRVLRCIEKGSRVQSNSSFSSTCSRMNSSSFSQESSITPSPSSSASKSTKQVALEKSREATASTSSDYQDAMSEFQMAEESVHHQFGESRHMHHLSFDNGASPSGSPGSVSSTTLGLYQRRKMKRQVLRLQSLEEVKMMPRFSSESSDVGRVIPEDVEEEFTSAFTTVS
ncbi:hypothetical protein EGW08_019338 [Elysia chlorotica]|uniref:Uncharacterized protein n=1 Tax=Elysia chlorotica TaxID=188477 RepID=A0A3S0Z848_ELYCH|nr:hypothetical protein EGW08_019338 [Elysia chlorotica]